MPHHVRQSIVLCSKSFCQYTAPIWPDDLYPPGILGGHRNNPHPLVLNKNNNPSRRNQYVPLADYTDSTTSQILASLSNIHRRSKTGRPPVLAAEARFYEAIPQEIFNLSYLLRGLLRPGYGRQNEFTPWRLKPTQKLHRTSPPLIPWPRCGAGVL